ncbi:MAG: 16S rRNA (adenine(1518)-N(6)/adenine(1519)-N(6))-dimethyltransferase RsmA [Candidatus Njordarchaeales archaeon]
MSLLPEIQHLCQLFDIRLNPNIGQHFITTRRILQLEVKIANLSQNDIVLDIGAGFGFLTEEIAKKAGLVYAVEIDKRILEALKFRLREYIMKGKIKIIEGDALKVPLPEHVNWIISNPPYHIISPLIIRILREFFTKNDFRGAIMILQREYVKKLFAKPGSKYWGRLSAAFRFFAKGKIIKEISPKYFFPMPEVDSVLVKMWPDRRARLVDFALYEKITAIVFQSPNKKLKRVLKDFLRQNADNWRALLNQLSSIINLEKRVREVSVEDLERVALFLKEKEVI